MQEIKPDVTSTFINLNLFSRPHCLEHELYLLRLFWDRDHNLKILGHRKSLTLYNGVVMFPVCSIPFLKRKSKCFTCLFDNYSIPMTFTFSYPSLQLHPTPDYKDHHRALNFLYKAKIFQCVLL